MQNSDFKEKRYSPRFEVAILCSCLEPSSRKAVDGETHNISAVGLCAITDKELPAQANLYIYLHMIDNKGDVYTQGKVVWTKLINPHKYKAGIRLEGQAIKPIQLVLRRINHKIKKSL